MTTRTQGQTAVDALMREGIRFKVEQYIYDREDYRLVAQLTPGWTAYVEGYQGGPLREGDEDVIGYSLRLDSPTNISDYLHVREATDGYHINYLAVQWGALLRSLAGYDPTMLSAGSGGSIYRAKTTHHGIVICRAPDMVTACTVMRNNGCGFVHECVHHADWPAIGD